MFEAREAAQALLQTPIRNIIDADHLLYFCDTRNVKKDATVGDILRQYETLEEIKHPKALAPLFRLADKGELPPAVHLSASMRTLITDLNNLRLRDSGDYHKAARRMDELAPEGLVDPKDLAEAMQEQEKTVDTSSHSAFNKYVTDALLGICSTLGVQQVGGRYHGVN